MTGLNQFNAASFKTSKTITQTYSTSFSLATSTLKKEHRLAIYAIYGFVRLADEIVDTFHEYDKKELLTEFENDLKKSIETGLSLNPVLHSFQFVVKQYNIPYEFIDSFLSSMKYDLDKKEYKTKAEADNYIYGSADVVGLMCLRVFCDRDEALFDKLKYPAMKLGSAFQKVNFLRDLKNDTENLGRSYFPGIDTDYFDSQQKKMIISEIEQDFSDAYKGIKQLPPNSRRAVFLAYLYYKSLLRKIDNAHSDTILNKRIRISNFRKMMLLVKAGALDKLNLL